MNFPRREHLRDSAERPWVNEEKFNWPLWLFSFGAAGLFFTALWQELAK